MAQNEKLPKLNIMILGKTGVGKSTLINSLFGENLAVTGFGRPVTQDIHKFETEDCPISIYDTPGMELDGQHSAENLLNDITKLIHDKMRSNDSESAIHCVLYCINTTSSRFEESESDFLQKLAVSTSQCNTPVILVLTQAFSLKKTEAMLNEVRKMTLPIRGIVPVLAQDYEVIDGYPTIKAFGLDKLVEVMSDVLPEAVRDTFVAMQIVNLDAKQSSAKKTVTAAALAAAATGAAPIPFSDAALLIPAQVAMLVRITAIYRIPIQKAALTTIATAAVGTVGTTILGKTIVSNALKFIPGIGTVAGGAISATTAAALTTALGNTYIGLMTSIAKGEMKTSDLSTKQGQEAFKREFKAQMRAGKN
ncbi:MAG: 50S ribosome-binding GTPase [Faecalibacterium sp.]|nr:50S ribosome-binding GTPase [Faecalibacterium sp.]